MSKMAIGAPANVETAPRAAVSNSARDLDRQARLAVEGVFLHSQQKRSMGHSSGFGGNLIDPETVQCTRWALAMETKHEEKPHGY
jgi:hypothetical protein